MAAKRKVFVHVRKDGNQVFFKGEAVESHDNIVRILDGDGEIVAIVFLAEGEGVGEYFKEPLTTDKT